MSEGLYCNSEGSVGVGHYTLVMRNCSLVVKNCILLIINWIIGVRSCNALHLNTYLSNIRNVLWRNHDIVRLSGSVKVEQDRNPIPRWKCIEVYRHWSHFLAWAAIPAMLCIAQEPNWMLYTLAYLACCCGNTLATDIGGLSSRLPRNALTLREVYLSLSLFLYIYIYIDLYIYI